MGMAQAVRTVGMMNQMTPGAPGQGQASQPLAAAPAEGSLEDKLKKLKAAFDAGLLDEVEFKAMKQKLLDAF
jgi:hypothetical protein